MGNLQISIYLFDMFNYTFSSYENGINIDNIEDETIVKIIDQVLLDFKENSLEEYECLHIHFEGGIYIQYGTNTIDSQCCSDIADIETWRDLLTAENTEWKDIWIGHPWVYYKFDDTYIYFSNYDDSGTDMPVTAFQISKKEFCALLELKLNMFDAFKQRVYQVIDVNDFAHISDKGIVKKWLFGSEDDSFLR
jgi:hypothetical protein